MRPSGATLSTSNTRWKLCNWNIRMVSTITIIAGKTACTDACALALSSTDPPATIR
jgi:thiamine pyrophosphokinase